MSPDIFISYSVEDRDKIDPIVQLIRVMKEGSVFQDLSEYTTGADVGNGDHKSVGAMLHNHCILVRAFCGFCLGEARI
jgi:hypothetical protein